jgi:hypothetical protein
MTKKDYELIAKCFHNQLSDITPENAEVIIVLAIHLCNQLEMTSHRFDRNKFLQACGVTE